jgi:hypothetical protein
LQVGFAAARETRAALEANGYQCSDASPQMLVNFNANSKQRTDVEPLPGVAAAPGLLGFRAGMYGAWAGYGPMMDQYDEATLVIDLVDAGKKQLMWEGSSSFDSNDSSKWTDKDVQRVVGQVITKVPPAG